MGCRMAAAGHRGPRQKVASRLGGTADKVSKEGTPERSAARERGDVVALVVLHGDPLPRPSPGSTPWPGRFVSGTTTDKVH
jgi:hypothetical protein